MAKLSHQVNCVRISKYNYAQPPWQNTAVHFSCATHVQQTRQIRGIIVFCFTQVKRLSFAKYSMASCISGCILYIPRMKTKWLREYANMKVRVVSPWYGGDHRSYMNVMKVRDVFFIAIHNNRCQLHREVHAPIRSVVHFYTGK